MRATASEAAQALPECGLSPTQQQDEQVRANLLLAEGESTTLPFGRDRAPDDIQIRFNIDNCEFEPETELRVRHRSFRREGARIPDDQIGIRAVTERDHVILIVSVDPEGVDPGSYKGDVSILDEKTLTATVPVTVTLQYDAWWLLALGSVLVLALGTFLVVAGGTNPFASGWMRGLAKIIVAISAAGAAYFATYWKDETWGSDGWQVITLAGVMLSAYMASLTATNAATRTTGADGD